HLCLGFFHQLGGIHALEAGQVEQRSLDGLGDMRGKLKRATSRELRLVFNGRTGEFHSSKRHVIAPNYWILLPIWLKTVLALLPISRTTPITITSITASITAYSATSCPRSSFQRDFILRLHLSELSRR